MEPASIRYKNPGAMWGRTGRRPSADRIVATNAPIPLKWGSKQTVYLSDGTGQGNNIAVFDTWVQGICAQLDLWRTSPKYKNKQFDDAIAVWSGGNHVESYIDFVLKRVPGMTRNTVMNDSFWRSPMGVGFLKAQAWHEAGKPFPAPGPDWVKAQAIVFGEQSAVGTPSAINVQPQKSSFNPHLQDMQTKLISLNYHEVGDADGFWGGKTRGAVIAFLNDRGIDIDGITNQKGFTSESAGETVSNEIEEALAEGWSRPIAPKRADATVIEIGKKNEVVSLTLWQRFTAKIGMWFTGLGLGSSSIFGIYEYVEDKVTGVREIYKNIPPEVWFIIIGILVGVIYYTTRKALQVAKDNYNKGKIN